MKRSSSGSSVCIPQEIGTLSTFLPRLSSEINIVIIKGKNYHGDQQNLAIRRKNVELTLDWLIANNHLYKDIRKYNYRLDQLPDNGLIPEIFMEDSFSDDEEELGISSDLPEQSLSGPLIQVDSNLGQEENGLLTSIRKTTDTDLSVDQNQRPIDQDRTISLLVLCYPELFPFGIADVTDPARYKEIKLSDAITHYLHLGHMVNEQLSFPFAKSKSFIFFTLDLIENRRLKTQANVFLNILKKLKL